METKDIFTRVDGYIDNLFACEDDVLRTVLAECETHGLPPIQISAGQGKFLYLLAKMIGANHILELGTLGGYSTIWLARALAPSGKLVTLEYNSRHADVASRNLSCAGLSAKVEIVRGPALQTLPDVLNRAQAPFDLVFIDADKVNYPNYFRLVIPAMRSGSLLLADNVIREGAVLSKQNADASAQAARRFNALLAGDDRLEGIILQQVGIKGHDGMAIARVK